MNSMFETNENFPKGLPVPQRADILDALRSFGIEEAETIRLIDSTRNPADVRLNFIVDNKWVLRYCIAPDMTEKRLGELEKLVERYNAMGIKCPRFLKDSWGRYLHIWRQMQYYLTEYIDLPLAGDEDIRDKARLTREVQDSVARFAEKPGAPPCGNPRKAAGRLPGPAALHVPGRRKLQQCPDG